MKPEKNTPAEQPEKFTRLNEFRYIPSDSIKIGVSERGVKLIFCMIEDDGVVEQIGVHVGLHTAALLRNALIAGVKHHEQETGTKIEPALPSAVGPK